MAFHQELEYTDTEGNEDVSKIIDYCNTLLDSANTSLDMELNTCDVVMVGLRTLCLTHSNTFLSCADPRLEAYITDRNIADAQLDLRELLNLFDEYSISRDVV
jgi:hypothetical protein